VWLNKKEYQIFLENSTDYVLVWQGPHPVKHLEYLKEIISFKIFSEKVMNIFIF